MRALVAIAAVTVASFSIACGGETPPPATPPSNTAATPPPAAADAKNASATGPEKAGHDDKHGAMKPALHDFHEALAPIWHSAAGAERVAKACGGEKQLRERAAAVGDAELSAGVDAVKAACEKDGKTEVEAKLSTVHDRFHKLAEKH